MVVQHYVGTLRRIPTKRINVMFFLKKNFLFDAGFHSMIPFLTQYEPIQTTIQTDQVKEFYEKSTLILESLSSSPDYCQVSFALSFLLNGKEPNDHISDTC